MKLKMLLHAALLLVLSVCAAQAVTIDDVGLNPFHMPPLTSVEDLKQMMGAKQAEIQQGMDMAGYSELYQPLMEQISHAQINKVRYAPGQSFLWMLSKYEGQGPVQVISDMVLGGSNSVPAYEFAIYKDGRRYVFSVPFVCGNLALKEIDGGAQTSCPSCPGFAFRMVADVGYLHQSDPADYLLLRVGVEHPISERLSFLAMLGGAPHLSGTDGDDAVLIDFLLQYEWFRMMLGGNQWSPVFVGAGLGGWMTSGDDELDGEDSDVDIIANLGTRIYGQPDSFSTSLFFEARSGVDELDSIGEYGRFGAGLRFRF